MDKAFLCHSSADKDYVERVAKRLGRARVVFDQLSFAAGEDFRQAIRKGLVDSKLFAMFVSQASLQSTWCKFEIDEGELEAIQGNLRARLAIIIDPRVTFADLPRWLQRSRAIVQLSPVQAAREIERELFSIAPTSLAGSPFVGRQQLQTEFVEKLAVGMDSSPHVFFVSGLEGLGRRSYLSRVLADNLGLTLGPFRFVDDTTTLLDIFLWVLDETADTMTRERFAEEARAFDALPPADQAREIVVGLKRICEGRFVPCLVDTRGMLTDTGEVSSEYETILQEFATDSLSYIAIVGTRAPRLLGARYEDRTILQRVPPLRSTEVRLLLQQLMRHNGIAISDVELDELVPYVDGYPPAASFLAQQARTYGLAATIADKSILVDFKAKRFTRFLLDLRLHDTEWDVLQYLAAEQLVPLSAIAVALEREPDDIAQVVRKLIDNSLAVVAGDNLAISAPIRDAVTRARGYLSAAVYTKIRERLTQTFWTGASVAPTIEVVDATLHAVARSGSSDFDPYDDLVRVSTVHRLAKESYFRREYAQALEYARRATKMRSRNFDVLAIQFKALVRLERWAEAEKILEEIRGTGRTTYWFLRGFMLRRRRRYEAAREAYEAAFAAGDRSPSLHRDYADCLHRLGKLAEATAQIKQSINRGTENVFVLDLALRIYLDSIKRRTQIDMSADEVAGYLADLDRFDVDRRFIDHRRATIFSAQERWAEALEHADRACDLNQKSFEVFALRADVLIEMGRYGEAATAIESIEQTFQYERDVQLGLRVKLATRRGNWREALLKWNELSDKTRPVHQALLMRIKEQQAADPQQTLVERGAAKRAADEIRSSITLPQSSPVLDAVIDGLETED